MHTYTIKHNGEIIATLPDQKSDARLFGVMQSRQSNSIFWAISYEGWEITRQDQNTGIIQKAVPVQNHWEFKTIK
jgi:hypothetical protein